MNDAIKRNGWKINSKLVNWLFHLGEFKFLQSMKKKNIHSNRQTTHLFRLKFAIFIQNSTAWAKLSNKKICLSNFLS